jgi:hypothetical protein
VNSYSAQRQLTRLAICDLLALSLAARDPRTPWFAQLAAASTRVIDTIPLLNLINDRLLVPFALGLVPPAVLEEHHATALGLLCW